MKKFDSEWRSLRGEHYEQRMYIRELAELILSQPYCRIVNLVEADLAQRQFASVYLKTLASNGFLEERKAGRERLFVNPALLSLLMSEGD